MGDQVERLPSDKKSRTEFASRLKQIYLKLSKSRLVKERETDSEAIQYFQNILNDVVHLERETSEGRTATEIVRDLYHGDKTGFTNCLNRASYPVLLTNSRAIVLHFGIQDLVYIDWDKEQAGYLVRINDTKGKKAPPRRRRKPQPAKEREHPRERELQSKELEATRKLLADLAEKVRLIEAKSIPPPPPTPPKEVEERKEEPPQVSWGDLCEQEEKS